MLESCIKYFKDNEAYQRIFAEMRRKWRSYGRISGSIVLTNASTAEREAIGLFLGRSFEKGLLKFRMSEFEEVLQNSEFKGVIIQELLEGYFCEKLITNKEENLEKAEAKQAFFEAIIIELSKEGERYKDTIKWLEQISEKKRYGYTIIISEYEKNEEGIKTIIINVCNAVTYLQSMRGSKIHLAVLATEITSDPHYFDYSSQAGRLLIYALSFINEYEYPVKSEDILELYYISNIKSGDISSFTTAYGIRLYTNEGVHPSYEAFIRNNEPYMITLMNLNKIVKADCISKKIFVFENQMVFSHMCEALGSMPVSMICTSGQMKTASLILINLLCQAGCTLYYSGDIDPEGIKLADKIIRRNPLHIIPWMISIKDYEISVSNEKLDEYRIRKLEKVKDERFKEVIKALKNKKRAGYQELLIDSMLSDIKVKLKDIDSH